VFCGDEEREIRGRQKEKRKSKKKRKRRKSLKKRTSKKIQISLIKLTRSFAGNSGTVLS